MISQKPPAQNRPTQIMAALWILLGFGLVIFAIFKDVILGSGVVGRLGYVQITLIVIGLIVIGLGVLGIRFQSKVAAVVKSHLDKIAQGPMVGRLRGIIVVLNALYGLIFLALLMLIIRSMIDNDNLIQAGLLAKGVVTALITVSLIAVALLGRLNINGAVCFIVTAVFIFSQVVLSPARFTNFPSADDAHHNAPYIMFAGRPDALDHNALGYRGPLPDKKDGSSEYRIVMIGGSTVYGNGPIDQTIPAHLERIAHEAGDTAVRVYNWGVNGQHSEMEVLTIAARAAEYDPDLIIIYDGANDLTIPYTWDPRIGYPYNFSLIEHTTGAVQGSDSAALTGMLLTQSNLLRAFYLPELEGVLAPVGDLRSEVDYGSVAWREAIVDNYAQNLENACQMSEGFGFRLVGYLQPISAVSENDELSANYIRSFYRDMYPRMQSAVQSLVDAHADDGEVCTFAELSEICTGDQCEFTDGVHVTPETRAYIAGVIYQHLLDQGIR